MNNLSLPSVIIWIVVGLSSILFTIIFFALESNLTYWMRKLSLGSKYRKLGTGRPPRKQPTTLWILFFITAAINIIGIALLGSSDLLPNPTPASTPTPALTLTPSATSIPTPLPPPNQILEMFNDLIKNEIFQAIIQFSIIVGTTIVGIMFMLIIIVAIFGYSTAKKRNQIEKLLENNAQLFQAVKSNVDFLLKEDFSR